jgi:uncharacterized protein YidB (DUF937 family)
MGLLEELLRGGLQGGLGQAMGRQQRPTGQAGGGMAGTVMALLPIVLAMLNQRQGGTSTAGAGAGMGGLGGLGGILEQFQRAGYGDQAHSWVGTGPNLPISPEVIAQVFGRDGLAQIASQAGLSEQQASAGLTEVFPEVVDRLTPQGEVPDLDALSASVGDLQRRLGL